LGIGDWGLGIGDWAQSPIPNPQSPIPNYFSILFFKILTHIRIFLIINYNIFLIKILVLIIFKYNGKK